MDLDRALEIFNKYSNEKNFSSEEEKIDYYEACNILEINLKIPRCCRRCRKFQVYSLNKGLTWNCKKEDKCSKYKNRR